MKKHLTKILVSIIIAALIGALSVGINYYIDSKVKDAELRKDQEIEIIHEKFQDKLIKINSNNLDSFTKTNTTQHKELSDDLNNISNNLHDLTRVIVSNNKQMARELKEIKEYNESRDEYQFTILAD